MKKNSTIGAVISTIIAAVAILILGSSLFSCIGPSSNQYKRILDSTPDIDLDKLESEVDHFGDEKYGYIYSVRDYQEVPSSDRYRIYDDGTSTLVMINTSNLSDDIQPYLSNQKEQVNDYVLDLPEFDDITYKFINALFNNKYVIENIRISDRYYVLATKNDVSENSLLEQILEDNKIDRKDNNICYLFGDDGTIIAVSSSDENGIYDLGSYRKELS